jgi:polyisoprenoid-binding protein YceI
MKKRSIWLAGIGIVLIVIVAALFYTTRFASTVNPPHRASGAATASQTTPSASANAANLRTFQIVPDQTTASYSVYENLIVQDKPNNDAVGTTHSVQGSFKIQAGASPQIAAMNITVDLRTLQTDSSMRDHFVQRNALQTDSYPDATFVSISAQDLPASYSDGQNVHFQLTGNLTMHGKTNKEVFDVRGKVVGATITGTASSTIYMTDFGIQPPNLANIAISQNKVQITINFTAKETV